MTLSPRTRIPIAARVPAERLREIAALVGTPTYVYDGRALDASVRRWVEAVGEADAVCYAVKANSNLSVLARLARTGIGFEVATLGELSRCLKVGVSPRRIVLGGVPKTAGTLEVAMKAGLGLLVLQAETEIEEVARAATVLPPEAEVPIGLRVRPGIRAGSHPSLETAHEDAKFGIGPDRIPELWARMSRTAKLAPRALAVHLGSGLMEPDPWEKALGLLLELRDELAGSRFPVAEIDLGGGLGISYEGEEDPRPEDLVRRVRARIEESGLRVRYEPGRSVVARAGILLTRVLYRRSRNEHSALVCDAGFTDFSRHALYGAEHRIVPVGVAVSGPPTVEVLGPTCESGDRLGTKRSLHGVDRGDLLAVRDAGAYGFVMASNYNGRPKPAEVLVDGEGWRVVRARETVEDLWRGESPE